MRAAVRAGLCLCLALGIAPAASFIPPAVLPGTGRGSASPVVGRRGVGARRCPVASLGPVRGAGSGRADVGGVFGARMSTVKDVAEEVDLLQVVRMASQPLPNRPDGTVTVIMYTSVDDWGCKSCESEYERLSEKMPDCVFLRCYKEYRGADMFLSARSVTSLPAFEVFYRDARVATVTGPQLDQVETKMQQFGFVKSKTDFFSQDAAREAGAEKDENGEYIWDRMAEKAARDSKKTSKAKDTSSAPRTTMRFLPGNAMGTDGDEYRKDGSLMDFFQNNRQPGAQKGGVSIPDAAPAPGSQPAGMRMPEGGGGRVGGDSDDPLDRLNEMWDEGHKKKKPDESKGKGDDMLDKIWDDYK